MWVRRACGEGITKQRWWLGRHNRLDAWMPTGTPALWRVQVPIRACV